MGLATEVAVSGGVRLSSLEAQPSHKWPDLDEVVLDRLGDRQVGAKLTAVGKHAQPIPTNAYEAHYRELRGGAAVPAPYSCVTY